jgi:hypothetical protein
VKFFVVLINFLEMGYCLVPANGQSTVVSMAEYQDTNWSWDPEGRHKNGLISNFMAHDADSRLRLFLQGYYFPTFELMVVFRSGKKICLSRKIKEYV